MVIYSSPIFNTFCPYIKTEERIFELLRRDADIISDEYVLIGLPLAHMINTIGVCETNKYISNISVSAGKRRVFVCQHIQVDKLIFKDTDIIFTPHCIEGSIFKSIPHYAVNYDAPQSNKKDSFSFIGSISTHWTRRRVVSSYNNCLDSGTAWGLDSNLSDSFKRRYIDHTNNFKYSLCPRGTGISSVRLFESMAMNCTPVIIADGYKLPLDDFIDWNNYVIRVPEADIDKLPEYIKPKSDIFDLYSKYLSNDKLHTSVMISLLQELKNEKISI